MIAIIENYVPFAFDENSYYGMSYQDTALIVILDNGQNIDTSVLKKFCTMHNMDVDDLAYLAYEIVDCGMKDDAEWYKVAVQYVTEENFWAADRRRKRVLYG